MTVHALDLLTGRPVLVLSSAGVSTDSGIPDYRGPGSPARRPMTYQEFTGSEAARRRYWARSHLGWSRMGAARPNTGHQALARLEAGASPASAVPPRLRAVGGLVDWSWVDAGEADR